MNSFSEMPLWCCLLKYACRVRITGDISTGKNERGTQQICCQGSARCQVTILRYWLFHCNNSGVQHQNQILPESAIVWASLLYHIW